MSIEKGNFNSITCYITYQVTNRGADILASSLERSILFKYTIEIDTIQ